MTSEEWGKREEEDHLRGHFCEKRRGGGVLASSGADDVGPTSGEKIPPCPALSSSLAVQEISPSPYPPSILSSSPTPPSNYGRERGGGERGLFPPPTSPSPSSSLAAEAAERTFNNRGRGKLAVLPFPPSPLFWKVPPFPSSNRGERRGGSQQKGPGENLEGEKALEVTAAASPPPPPPPLPPPPPPPRRCRRRKTEGRREGGSSSAHHVALTRERGRPRKVPPSLPSIPKSASSSPSPFLLLGCSSPFPPRPERSEFANACFPKSEENRCRIWWISRTLRCLPGVIPIALQNVIPASTVYGRVATTQLGWQLS